MSDSVRVSNSTAFGSICRTALRTAGSASSGSPVVRMNSVTPLPFCRSNGKYRSARGASDKRGATNVADAADDLRRPVAE